ncbi:MAG: methyltransferase domain-containing protein [Anaeromyxobacter sp.]
MNLVDKRRVRAAFSRAAAAYDGGAALQREVQRRVLAAALAALPAPARALDVGAGTGALVAALREAQPACRVAAVDLASGMAAAARARTPSAAVAAADAEALPFGPARFDLYLSTSTLQWLPRLAPAFAEARRVLAPGGVLAVALFGADTLHELRSSWRAAAGRGATPTHRFATRDEVAAALLAEGFEGAEVTETRVVERHPDARSVLRGLKAIGATNAVPGERGLGGRAATLALLRAYEERHPALEGGVTATWHVVYALATRR